MIKGLMSLYPNPSNFNWLTASHSIQDLLKKLRGTIESKDNELQTKEQQLNEAKQQELLTSQAKLEFELNAVRTKDSRIVELEIKVKLKSFHRLSWLFEALFRSRLSSLTMIFRSEIRSCFNKETLCDFTWSDPGSIYCMNCMSCVNCVDARLIMFSIP